MSPGIWYLLSFILRKLNDTVQLTMWIKLTIPALESLHCIGPTILTTKLRVKSGGRARFQWCIYSIILYKITILLSNLFQALFAKHGLKVWNVKSSITIFKPFIFWPFIIYTPPKWKVKLPMETIHFTLCKSSEINFKFLQVYLRYLWHYIGNLSTAPHIILKIFL